MATGQQAQLTSSKRAGLWPPLLPREHGAWMMLLVPLIVGALAGGSLSPYVLLTIAAAFFAYLARHPLVLIARVQGQHQRLPAATPVWLLIYAGIAGLCGLAVVALGGYWSLLGIVALAAIPLGVNLYLATRRAEMTLAGELLGIAGLSLGAPATYFVATGSFGHGFGLWLLSFLYFGGTVFYIKLKVRVQARQDAPASRVQRFLIARATVIYHVAVLAASALLVASGLVPLLAPLAYVPATCKAVHGAVDWRRPVNVKRLGVIEIVHSLVFALLLVVAYY